MTPSDPLTALADFVSAHRAEGMQAQVFIDADETTIHIFSEEGRVVGTYNASPARAVASALALVERTAGV